MVSCLGGYNNAMRHVQPALKVFFILLCLILASVAPVLLTGYARLGQAETALAAEDYALAAASFESAAQFLPWRVDLWERAAAAALFAGQSKKTVLYFSHVRRPSLNGYLILGSARLQRGELELALSAFQSALDVYGPSASSYSFIAELHRRRGDLLAERDALRNQLELDFSNARVHYRLGLIMMVLDAEKALTELMLAASLDSEFDPAVHTLRTALNLSAVQPDSTGQLVTIGRALGLVNEWLLAAEAFRQAVETDAENANAWAWLGEAKQHLAQDGRVELDRALSLDNKSVIVRGLRGLYWTRQEKYPQALAEYLLAAGLDPENSAWQASIGESYTLLGDLPSALTAYQRAAEMAPNDAAYWRLLAVFCAANGVRVEDVGLPAAQKAVELAPEDALALDALGWSYLSSGRLALAVQTLLEALERAPDYYPARLHLAMTYLSQGNSNAAYVELTHVRDVDPNGPSGQLAVQLLEQYFP